MNDLIAPTLLIMVTAHMIVSMFMDVLPMAVNTVIMCYITDTEQNNGTAKYSDPEITAFIEKFGAPTEHCKP